MPTGYSRPQIVLHWITFLILISQFVFHDFISDAFDAMLDGRTVAFHPLIALHVFGGFLVFVLALVRLQMRASRGVPPLPEDEPAPLKLLAHVTHYALYALLILLPISGAVAWFQGVEAAGEAHEVMRGILLVLVGLHVAGALVQQFVLKTNIMARMRTPG